MHYLYRNELHVVQINMHINRIIPPASFTISYVGLPATNDFFIINLCVDLVVILVRIMSGLFVLMHYSNSVIIFIID